MTFHADILHNMTESALLRPGVGEFLAGVLKRMTSGYYEDLDMYMQHPRKRIDVYDAFAFTRIREMVFSGEKLRVDIEVGAPPYADCDVRKNNELLERLPKPFAAEFIPARGGGANNDGYLLWNEPILLFGAHDPDDNKIDVPFQVKSGSRTVALEVGTIECSRTLVHLLRTRSLARWPYGSTKIHLFVDAQLFGAEPWPAGVPFPSNTGKMTP